MCSVKRHDHTPLNSQNWKHAEKTRAVKESIDGMFPERYTPGSDDIPPGTVPAQGEKKPGKWG